MNTNNKLEELKTAFIDFIDAVIVVDVEVDGIDGIDATIDAFIDALALARSALAAD